MTHHVAFCDCETLGLDAAVHPVWEVGLIVDDVEHHWFATLPVGALAAADPEALAINRFDERYDPAVAVHPAEIAREMHPLLAGRAVVGANPMFDLVRLEPWFDLAGLDTPWHYRPCCIESVVYGWLHGYLAGEAGMGYLRDGAVPPGVPWRASDLYERFQQEQSPDEKHTALGDCRFVKRLWEAVHGG